MISYVLAFYVGVFFGGVGVLIMLFSLMELVP